MRIAIYEPHPRVCGVTKYTFELVQGFRDLGHHADVVSFTKSGRARKAGAARAGWGWWSEAPDVVAKFEHASDVLNTYDLIVLNEPKNGTDDNTAGREKRLPEYITVLQRVHVPWMSVLHAPQYDPKRAPFLEQTLSTPSFTGILVEHVANSLPSSGGIFERYAKLVQPWPWLPYTLRGAPADVQRDLAISVSGRCTPNKGHPMLAFLGDQFPAGWTTRLRGAEAGGMGAGCSYIIWDGLNHLGWSGWRDGQGPAHPKFTPNPYNNMGDKIAAWKWWVAKDEHVVQYTASYGDSVRTLAEDAVTCCLTNIDFSCQLEYTMLEGMDAGCAIVVPDVVAAAVPGPYRLHPITGYEKSVTCKASGEPRWDRLKPGAADAVVAAVQEACADVLSGYDPEVNREAIRTQHAPSLLAQRMLDLVGGG